MTEAALSSADAIQDSLPVCLCPPWVENPNGLVSLLDMLRFNAHHWVGMTSVISQAILQIQAGQILSDRSQHVLKGNCDLLLSSCDVLGLSFSSARIKRFQNELLRSMPWEEVRSSLMEIQSRLWDELDCRIYVQVPLEAIPFFEPKEPPFGAKVFNQFPSAIDDVLEAGNCIALERTTAAVFHLMRVMEAALKALAKELGIAYAPSWESYLRQLRTLIESDWKSKSPDEQKRQPFYKEAIGDLEAIKLAWRNPTMHIVRSYGYSESAQIHEAVKAFMIRLADAGVSE